MRLNCSCSSEQTEAFFVVVVLDTISSALLSAKNNKNSKHVHGTYT